MSQACEVVVYSHNPRARQSDVAEIDLETADLGLRGITSRTVVWGERTSEEPGFDCDDIDLMSPVRDGVYRSTSTEGMYAIRHPRQTEALAAFRRRFPKIDPAYPEGVVLEADDDL